MEITFTYTRCAQYVPHHAQRRIRGGLPDDIEASVLEAPLIACF